MTILQACRGLRNNEKLVQKLEAEYREAKNLFGDACSLGSFRWWERL